MEILDKGDGQPMSEPKCVCTDSTNQTLRFIDQRTVNVKSMKYLARY